MKRLFGILIVWFLLCTSVIAADFYGATSLTGNVAGALDYIDGDDLLDGDGAFVITDGISYQYRLDDDSGLSESSPRIIAPDTNPGTKRWILNSDIIVTSPWIDVRAYGAIGDGVADDTTAIQAALTAGQVSNLPVHIPAGTYLVSQLTNFASGSVLYGDGLANTILQGSAANTTIISLDAAGLHHITMTGFAVSGYDGTGTGHGIHIYNDDGANYNPSNLFLDNLYIHDCGGKGLYVSQEFSSIFRRIYVSMCGDNAIELQGGNTTTLENCYVQKVAATKCGYRIYGSPVMISCNGVNQTTPETANVDWAVFGQHTGDGDAVINYARPTLINCNIESFSRYGVRFKEGSGGSFIGTVFTSSTTTATVPLYYDTYPNSTVIPIWDGTSVIGDGGGGWTNSVPIHARGMPFMAMSSHANITSFYNHNDTLTYVLPTITSRYNSYLQYGWNISNVYLPKVEFIVNNTPIALANDGTPTVAAYNIWRTSGTTTITDFDNGVAGQIITVLCKTSLTFDFTTAQDADHNLDGSSANITADTGDILTFLSEDGTRWVLISNNDASVDNN